MTYFYCLTSKSSRLTLQVSDWPIQVRITMASSGVMQFPPNYQKKNYQLCKHFFTWRGAVVEHGNRLFYRQKRRNSYWILTLRTSRPSLSLTPCIRNPRASFSRRLWEMSSSFRVVFSFRDLLNTMASFLENPFQAMSSFLRPMFFYFINNR